MKQVSRMAFISMSKRVVRIERARIVTPPGCKLEMNDVDMRILKLTFHHEQ
jgi:hypothetical protein